MGVSGIQSNCAETPYGDIRNGNTEQAIACAIWCLLACVQTHIFPEKNFFSGKIWVCMQARCLPGSNKFSSLLFINFLFIIIVIL